MYSKTNFIFPLLIALALVFIVFLAIPSSAKAVENCAANRTFCYRNADSYWNSTGDVVGFMTRRGKCESGYTGCVRNGGLPIAFNPTDPTIQGTSECEIAQNSCISNCPSWQGHVDSGCITACQEARTQCGDAPAIATGLDSADVYATSNYERCLEIYQDNEFCRRMLDLDVPSIAVGNGDTTIDPLVARTCLKWDWKENGIYGYTRYCALEGPAIAVGPDAPTLYETKLQCKIRMHGENTNWSNGYVRRACKNAEQKNSGQVSDLNAVPCMVSYDKGTSSYEGKWKIKDTSGACRTVGNMGNEIVPRTYAEGLAPGFESFPEIAERKKVQSVVNLLGDLVPDGIEANKQISNPIQPHYISAKKCLRQGGIILPYYDDDISGPRCLIHGNVAASPNTSDGAKGISKKRCTKQGGKITEVNGPVPSWFCLFSIQMVTNSESDFLK